MKYEIRIISEEDTIRSKPYEDLDKAIEVADKMFNDFVNTDFGDEIVVVEENSKNKKYYWANGKTLIEELKVGDIVVVTNSGATYTTYVEFMKQYASKEQCCYWDLGRTPQTNNLFEILGIAPHERLGEGNLAIIKEKNYEGKVYLINVSGLRKA